MNHRTAVITVVNSISPTSMPFNEFAAYRSRWLTSEEHHVVVLNRVDQEFLLRFRAETDANRLTIHECGGLFSRLRTIIIGLLKEFRECGVPHLVHTHQAKTAIAVRLLCFLSLRATPVVHTVHSLFDRYRLHNKLMTVPSFLAADCVSFVSQASFDAFPKVLRFIREQNLYVIPNGVDLRRVDAVLTKLACEELGCRNDKAKHGSQAAFQLINIGRIDKAKNQFLLIDMLAKLPQVVSLTVIGEGHLRQSLSTAARRAGLEHRVRFKGLIPRQAVYRELVSADMFVSPSLWEGLPIGTLEAMAIRLPVLLSDIGPHREIADRGSSVRILPFDSVKWAAEIESFVAMAKSERDAIGRANRELIESDFSLDRMHVEYTKLYETLWDFSGEEK